jgi:hypothetical protein
MVILKALEYIQYSKADEKTVLVYSDSRITLQLLQNQKKHTHIIEQIRTKVTEMEQQEWIVEFSWIKAHTGHHRNELADRLAKAVSSKTIKKRLRWSRDSMLPLSTQVHGFKPGQNHQDFSGQKNPQHTFLQKGSKAVGPML